MFSRIWDSIRRGRHVELYLVLVVSTVAVVLAILDVGSQRLVSTLTVTALGLTGFALIEQRIAVQAGLDRLADIGARAKFQDEPVLDLPSALKNSSLVMLAGVDLSRTFGRYEAELKDYVQAGKRLRVMLYDPEGTALDHAVVRSRRHFSRDREVALIENSCYDFLTLRALSSADGVEVRLSQVPFPYGVVAADYRSENGSICLKHYTFKGESYDKPWICLASADGRWYAQFAGEIDSYWDEARPVVA
ncbi:hypothetical protein [Amycolatopsis eburnea]|uniref:Uncharacterized protein n=1 Tax=Amycolatopsis eburnea TaxID=2267691 RepID=A0A427SZ24_9PSEU|nr:hypothetical protein [Amycolatopsis eburnea]RSD10403.1 hypothetical protein EIY87_36700 [Amycolatopsis eburnea]